MKVLILTNNDLGLYNFRKELITDLLRRNVEVYIALPYGERVETLKRMGCRYIETRMERRGKNPFKDAMLFMQYIRILMHIKPDKVLTFTIKPNLYGGCACRILRRDFYPYVAGLGTPFQKGYRLRSILVLLHRYAFGNAKHVFFENAAAREFYIKNRMAKGSTTLLPGAGVNLEEYNSQPYLDDKNGTVFLFAGRVMKEKGMDELISCAKRLKQENANVRFEIVGTYEEDYKETMDKLQEQEIVYYLGFHKDIKMYYERCHCLVLPSYHEGMANVLLEAAAMGRPLITSDICGCREAVRDGENGYLCAVKNEESLYQGIKKFMGLPWEQKREFGIKSRELVSRKFDRKTVVDTVIKAIGC